MEHDNAQYCFQCNEYPCEKYDHIDDFDFFITSRNRRSDMDSRCSMQAGWNIKYKKGGKSLCTLYPMQGYFIALVVVGSHELTEAEFLMPQCSDYVQTVFKNTKTGNGQKWLMLDVRDREIMDDVFSLINLRKRIPS